MKKFFSLMFLLLTAILLISCEEDINNIDVPQNEVVTTSFVNKSSEYNIKDGVIDIHYLEEAYVPYVSIVDYLTLLDGVFYSDEFEYLNDIEKQQLTINYSVIYEEEEYNYSLEIDAVLDTFTVDDLAFFDGYVQTTNTDYSEGLINLDPIIEEGSKVIFELGLYDFDVIMKDDDFLMPHAIANTLFNQSNYFDTYYNGEVLYGIDTSEVDESLLEEIMKSKYNKLEMPENIKLHNYNFSKFVIDYFYGIKDDRNITSGDAFINKTEFLSGNVGLNIAKLINQIDDLHTSHISRGVYDNKYLKTTYSLNTLENVSKYYDDLDDVALAAQNYFGVKGNYIDIKDYEYIDNNKTLIIYLMGFDVDTPTEIENLLKNADVKTENVIIDLTFNSGGNLGAVLRMFVLMTNEEIKYHYVNPLNNEKVTYRVTGENPAYDQYKYFIKTSSVTFSAANLTASIAKELDIKVIGHKSSGGAAAISLFVYPDGTIINISSNTVLTNNQYESIEHGITPDTILNQLYNKNEIINAIS